MHIELDDLDAVREHLAAVGDLRNTVLQGIDLRALDLTDVAVDGALLLGCRPPAELAADLVERGAILVPALPGVPYRTYRTELYTVDELLEGWRPGVEGSFAADTLDARVYDHTRSVVRPGLHTALPVAEALAQRLHDHSIDDALGDLLDHHPDVVGIMGGHSLHRSDPGFLTVARIARELARAGLLVATGGGPGAMEAGNLGAWCATLPDEALDDAVGHLSAEDDYRNADAYLAAAADVRSAHPGHEPAVNLAVPTWFYGHEPTNLFATHVAKYFANSIREDGLLAIANRGVLFTPGAAGTTQEIFQDATQNHYRVFGSVSPMVLLGVDHWTEVLPAVPLLRSLAQRGDWDAAVTVTDDPDVAVAALLA